MICITFIHADGGGETQASGVADDSLLGIGQAAGMPLEGTCEGQMACSTCHAWPSPSGGPSRAAPHAI